MNRFFLSIILSPFIIIGYPIYQVNFSRTEWNTLPSSECLMIMGAKVLQDNTPDIMLRERIETAEKIISSGTKTIIATGGTLGGVMSEAEVIRSKLIETGIDEERIVLEKESTSTYENLLNSRSLLEERGCSDLDIISHDFHLPRVKMTADRLGIETNRLIPADTSRPNSRDRLFREYLAYIWYWLGWKWLD